MPIMNFVEPYILAMREQAPAMFNQLRRSGQWDQHLKEVNHQAQTMLADLLRSNPKPGPAEEQAAEEQVFATLIDFPPKHDPDHLEPPDDLGTKGGTGNARPMPTSRAETTS